MFVRLRTIIVLELLHSPPRLISIKFAVALSLSGTVYDVISSQSRDSGTNVCSDIAQHKLKQIIIILLNIKVYFLYHLLSSFSQWVTVVAGFMLARYYEMTSPSFAITSPQTCTTLSRT